MQDAVHIHINTYYIFSLPYYIPIHKEVQKPLDPTYFPSTNFIFFFLMASWLVLSNTYWDYNFIMFAYIKSRWWYSSRGWSFRQTTHNLFLTCYRYQLSCNLVKWHLIWKSVWKMCVIEFLHAEKNCTHWQLLTLAECLWRPNSECEHRLWVMYFSIGNHHVQDKPCFRHSCTAANLQNE